MPRSIPVTVLPGDGIGPEVMRATLRVLEATGVPFAWDHRAIGVHAGLEIPKATLASIEDRGRAIKGPTATPLSEGHRSFNVELREAFGLYANIRPASRLPAVAPRYADVPTDIVIFRENLEDLYVGEEREDAHGAYALSRMTVVGCRRIALAAFGWAQANGRKKVTIVHKANILKKTHGLFLEMARQIAADYPDLECEDLIADNCMLQLVRAPDRFDVILAPNLLGDLLSDLVAGIVYGGLGFSAGANVGERCAIFEAVHGTAPDIAGKGIANPSALILSGALLLERVERAGLAARVRQALARTLGDGIYTGDVRREGAVGTDAFADALIARL